MSFVINPQRETPVRDVAAGEFTRAMARHGQLKGEAPRAEVWIQIRGRVLSLSRKRAALVNANRRLAADGVPPQRRIGAIAEAVREGGSRQWQDYELVSRGAFDPDRTRLPEPGELDRVKRETGAAEVRVVVRSADVVGGGLSH